MSVIKQVMLPLAYAGIAKDIRKSQAIAALEKV
jgi:hypothetical protein